MRRLSFPATTAVIVIALASFFDAAQAGPAPAVAVSPQYDTTHVLVAPEDFDRFTDSLVATFGGSKSQQGVIQVTPTPSQTISQLVFTPVGTISGLSRDGLGHRCEVRQEAGCGCSGFDIPGCFRTGCHH